MSGTLHTLKQAGGLVVVVCVCVYYDNTAILSAQPNFLRRHSTFRFSVLCSRGRHVFVRVNDTRSSPLSFFSHDI